LLYLTRLVCISIDFLSIMGFCVGAGVAITPLSVLNGAISTIFVCFAEVRTPTTWLVIQGKDRGSSSSVG
jgi:hypothetical protein